MLPRAYVEGYSLMLSQALVRGTVDPIGMQTLLSIVLTVPGLSCGKSALAIGLIALADAADNDDDAAWAHVRECVAHLGRPSPKDPPYEVFYRRLARGCVASACALLGDDVRANRIVDVEEVPRGDGIRDMPLLVRSERFDDYVPPLRGIARVLRAASARRRAEALPCGLTRAEFDVLRLLGNGWNAGRIAAETGRSVNTIYAHTKAVLMKLGARRSLEAVVIARERGLLV